MLLILHFMRRSAAPALKARFSLKSNSPHYRVKEVVLTAYCQGKNHLLETYVSDGILAELDSEIACYLEMSTMSLLEFESNF